MPNVSGSKLPPSVFSPSVFSSPQGVAYLVEPSSSQEEPLQMDDEPVMDGEPVINRELAKETLDVTSFGRFKYYNHGIYPAEGTFEQGTPPNLQKGGVERIMPWIKV